ncbi:MAG: hypothetical protein MSC30_17885 [Gaiellaceae bacterium MAG52_C11]|nr:hypothetical protein [Candidatus Gaiellasilicea maunaloa]
MTTDYSPPPRRELPPDRRRELKRHLLSEIARRPPGLAARPALTSLRGRATRRMGLAAAAVIVAAIVAGVLGTHGGTGAASAAEVRAKLAEGLELGESIRGEYSVRTRDPGLPPRGVRRSSNAIPQVRMPSRFVIGADGSYSSLIIPGGAASGRGVAYDATTGIETWLISGSSGRPIYLRGSNLDPAFFTRYAPEAQLAAWVQGALADRSPPVQEVTFAGRAAWSLTATFRPGETFNEIYGARVDVVVDRETGLVLRVVQYAYDTNRWTSIASVRNLKIGEPTNAGDFTLPKPRGVVERRHDYGFRRLPVAAAAATIGYRPLLPTNTLGRTLSDFAVAKTSKFPFPGIPVRRDIASARYGRGAAIITVSTYRGPLTDLTSLFGGEYSETVHPTHGPLVDSVAYLSTSQLGGGVFAAFADGLLVQITAPSAGEALTIANSLRATE